MSVGKYLISPSRLLQSRPPMPKMTQNPTTQSTSNSPLLLLSLPSCLFPLLLCREGASSNPAMESMGCAVRSPVARCPGRKKLFWHIWRTGIQERYLVARIWVFLVPYNWVRIPKRMPPSLKMPVCCVCRYDSWISAKNEQPEAVKNFALSLHISNTDSSADNGMTATRARLCGQFENSNRTISLSNRIGTDYLNSNGFSKLRRTLVNLSSIISSAWRCFINQNSLAQAVHDHDWDV